MTDHDHGAEVARWGICPPCVTDAILAERAAPPPDPAGPHFDGATYRAGDDHERLSGQVSRVFETMKDSEWRTLGEIARLLHEPEASISARLRDLRKPKFGGHTVERQHRGDPATGLYEYRLVLAGRLL